MMVVVWPRRRTVRSLRQTRLARLRLRGKCWPYCGYHHRCKDESYCKNQKDALHYLFHLLPHLLSCCQNKREQRDPPVCIYTLIHSNYDRELWSPPHSFAVFLRNLKITSTYRA